MLPKHVPLKTMTHADAVLKPFSPDPKGGGVVDPDAAPSRGFSSAVVPWALLLNCFNKFKPSNLTRWEWGFSWNLEALNGDFALFLGPFWNPWPPLLLNPFFGFSRYESDISRLLAPVQHLWRPWWPAPVINHWHHRASQTEETLTYVPCISRFAGIAAGIFFLGLTKNTKGKDCFGPEKTLASPQLQSSCEVGSCESPPILTGKSRKMTANKSAVPWASVMPALETPQSLKQRLGFR